MTSIKNTTGESEKAMLSYTKNNDREISMKVNVFVVPNRLGTIRNESFMDFRRLGRVDEVCNANKTSLSADDYMVQLWWTSPQCENWEDHHPMVDFNDQKWEIRFRSYDLPYDLIKDWNEGTPAKLEMPAFLYSLDNREKKEITIHLEVTPLQLEYRYRRFGTFENTAKNVCV